MWISRRVLVAFFAAAFAALSASLAAGAFGHDGGQGRQNSSGDGNRHGGQVISETLAPSVPSDPPFHGVRPGAAPWVLRRADVQLNGNGRFDLRVRGLVIPVAPANGTPGPVTTISASLYCGADSDTAAADTTQQVPISRAGDARIRDRSFNVPSSCLAPVILVHPNGDSTHYIAVDGRR